MKTNYKHISKRERKRIQELTQDGKTNKEIAEELGRSRSTIGRELERNWGMEREVTSTIGHRNWPMNNEKPQNRHESAKKHGKKCSSCSIWT